MNAASYYQPKDDDLLRCLEDYIEGQRATIAQLRATVRRMEVERLGCFVVARMVPHTKRLTPEGDYIVTVECGSCRTRQRVRFGGWSGLLCRPSVGGCGAEMQRTAYRIP